ncbi:ParB/RepB/Spo0J family partition protein [Acidiphilium sp.]|uniref:ParB/RepB/Spo0J family partition protein n=1 Tax=Acidiphilium sp. TaxID=527 RepID=UPI003D082367
MRDNRLAQLAGGSVVSRVHELVDPARCRIWGDHNRDYDALSEENCNDLIESFKAQGRQEVPAIVRRVKDDHAFDYEVICGARRHWSASWMRNHNYPEFRFLVEPRELTDEEAFRLADLENRSRRDLSDYERASDYLRAVDRYYRGSQQTMAERLEVSKSWLSRYLELARLPAEILRSFGSPHVIGVSHGAVLAPLLRKDPIRPLLISEAAKIAQEQQERGASGLHQLTPAAVLERLVAASKRTTGVRRGAMPLERTVRSESGILIARGMRSRKSGSLTIVVPTPNKFERNDVLSAITRLLEELSNKN